jgi:beta-phosphoglucomutase-like phosphatase (HAD superfamily)
MEGMVAIKGRVVSGARKAAGFTGLDWVELQCMSKLGFKPFPGTLNVELSSEGLRALATLQGPGRMELVSPDPSFCSAGIVPVTIGACAGALIILPEWARVHPENIVEVIAPVKLRDALGLEDGSVVIIASCEDKGPLHLRVGARLLPIRAVIFDLDGTLLDTREIYYTIMEILFDRLRFPQVSRDLLLEASANGHFDWEMVLPEEAKGRSTELQPVIRGILREISPALFKERNSLIPGVEPLLRRLFASGMKIGVATSTEARSMNMKLRPIRVSGLEPLIQAVVTADDVLRQKPAPEPLIECALRLGVQTADCLYCGDMRVDVRAGRAAGMITAAVLTGFDSAAILQAEGPDLLLDSVAELQFQ